MWCILFMQEKLKCVPVFESHDGEVSRNVGHFFNKCKLTSLILGVFVLTSMYMCVLSRTGIGLPTLNRNVNTMCSFEVELLMRYTLFVTMKDSTFQ